MRNYFLTFLVIPFITCAAPEVIAAEMMIDTSPIKAGLPADSEMVYRANLGRAEDMDLLIRQGGSLRASDNNGVGLLFLAAARRDDEGLSMVRTLLAHGLPVNGRDPTGKTPLFYAAKAGNNAVVQFLLDNGADMNMPDTSGEYARSYAYRAGHPETMTMMDNYARRKVEEINNQYAALNQQLAKRYEDLNKAEKEKVKGKSAPAATAQSYPEVHNPPPPAPAAVAAPVATPIPTPIPTPAPTPTPTPAATAQPRVTPTPVPMTEDERKAKEIAADVTQKMKDLSGEDDLKARIKQEKLETEYAEGYMQRKMQEETIESSNEEEREKRKAAIDAENEAARKTEEKLHNTLYDTQMQDYLKAEVASEAEGMKIEQDAKAMKDPTIRKARIAEKQKADDEMSKFFYSLAYNNCVFQYWYYCYTSGLTTELKSNQLNDAIEASKNKIADVQDTLLNDYKVAPGDVNKIATSSKKRVFDQLDRMHSSRQRRSEGVGNVSDMSKRCDDIALHWDILAGSVLGERKHAPAADISAPLTPGNIMPQNNGPKGKNN